MLSNNLNAIGDFISYSGNTVGELVSTYLSELIDEYSASGQGRFAFKFTHCTATLYEASSPSHSLLHMIAQPLPRSMTVRPPMSPMTARPGCCK